MIKKVIFLIFASTLVLSACSNKEEQSEGSKNHDSHMKHNDESKAPEDMTSTDQGKFKKGDEVTITAGHMPGMKGAEATIKGAYKTHAYVVSYEPTNGDKKVNNHKWVVNEEIKEAPEHGFSAGDTVKLEADHMPGMKGATADVDDVKETTVYMVDYKSKDDGKTVKNHKWMTDDELKSR
ncbi:YdhK family protein [Staphylococcus arlettae]|uniref:YdhK family protein n=1 Tax=Staphylococcus arlettae TaxID=29378 RepID=UPI003CEB9043